MKGVDKELNETEEFLSLQCMKDTTTGANIFSEVLNAFDKFGLDLSTLSGIATDRSIHVWNWHWICRSFEICHEGEKMSVMM